MLMEFIRGYYLKLPKPYKKKARKLYDFYLYTSSRLKWLPKNITSIFLWNKYKDRPLDDLNLFEKKIYSQDGEDGILEAIFCKIRATNKYAVEFGVGNGEECNTRYLLTRKGWQGLQMDLGDDLPPTIKKEYVTPENVNLLFKKYNVPQEFDLLSIDVDSYDYWIWKALEGYRPRTVVIEYNSAIPATESIVINPDPKILKKYPESFGAGLLALSKLGKSKGYTLVACDSNGINSFFVRTDLLKDNFVIRDIKAIYCPPHYGPKVNGKYVWNVPNKEAMLQV